MKRITAGMVAMLVPLLGVANSPARAQTPQGVKITTDALEIDIGGRVHTQFNTTSVDSEPDAQWIMRRVRLETDVRTGSIVSGRLQVDFGRERVSIKDAFVKLDLHPAFQLLAGKAHRPFSLIEQTSSLRMLPIERGLEIRGLSAFDEYALVHDLGYSDRDVGLQVTGKPAGAPLSFAYAAGVFGSPVQGRVGSESPMQFAARATVQPHREVRLGAGWSNRPFGRRVAPGGNEFDIRRGSAFVADLELGAFDPGFHLIGEVTAGVFDPFVDADFFGGQAWLGYRTRPITSAISAVEPILRVSHGDIQGCEFQGCSIQGGDGTLITPGVNIYFGSLNRVMINYDLWSASGGDTEGSFKAMFQMAF